MYEVIKEQINMGKEEKEQILTLGRRLQCKDRSSNRRYQETNELLKEGDSY